MKIQSIIWISIFIILMISCNSQKHLTEAALVVPVTEESPINNSEQMSGAIRINAQDWSKYVDQALFIGFPNTALEEPLVARQDKDRVIKSELYKNLKDNGLKSIYLIERSGDYFFNYRAFRNELVHQGLTKKFGL